MPISPRASKGWSIEPSQIRSIPDVSRASLILQVVAQSGLEYSPWKREVEGSNPSCLTNLLRCRLMVGHLSLTQVIAVRVLSSQPVFCLVAQG